MQGCGAVIGYHDGQDQPSRMLLLMYRQQADNEGKNRAHGVVRAQSCRQPPIPTHRRPVRRPPTCACALRRSTLSFHSADLSTSWKRLGSAGAKDWGKLGRGGAA